MSLPAVLRVQSYQVLSYIDLKDISCLACTSKYIASIARIGASERLSECTLFIQALIRGLGAEAENERVFLFRTQKLISRGEVQSPTAVDSKMRWIRDSIIATLGGLSTTSDSWPAIYSAASYYGFFKGVGEVARVHSEAMEVMQQRPLLDSSRRFQSLAEELGIQYALDQIRRIQDRYDQDKPLAGVARAITEMTGDINKAIDVARMIKSKTLQSYVVKEICTDIAEAGDIRGSLNLINTVFADEDREQSHGEALEHIVKILVKSGKIDWALCVAYMIPPPLGIKGRAVGPCPQSRAFSNIFHSLVESVDLDRALDIVHHHFHKDKVLYIYRQFIDKELDAGNRSEAENILALIPQGQDRDRALHSISMDLVLSEGKIDEGIELMSTAQDKKEYELFLDNLLTLGNEEVQARILEMRPDLRT